jgi:hypothetical protein
LRTVTAIVGAIDAVLQAAIIGGQQVVDAILPLDLGNLINAFVDATGDFFASFGTAGTILVDGIVFVQQTIAEALAAQPPVNLAATEADLTGPAVVPDPDGGDATFMTLSTDGPEDTPQATSTLTPPPDDVNAS